jgi:hypothetical protein
MRHAKIDQARLLPPGDHLDRKAQRGFGLFQELFGILRHAQGVGGHRAHSARVEIAQAFAKARQGIDAALLRCTSSFLSGSGRPPAAPTP